MTIKKHPAVCGHSLRHTYTEAIRGRKSENEHNGTMAEVGMMKMAAKCLTWATSQRTVIVTEILGTSNMSYQKSNACLSLSRPLHPSHPLSALSAVVTHYAATRVSLVYPNLKGWSRCSVK